MNSISVAMAVYNGEKYIGLQIDSIVKQLDDKDELVISYNESSDNTLEIIRGYERDNPNVKVFINMQRGIISNFNEAITKCQKDIIVLSDQDDVWLDNKLDTIRKAFNDKTIVLYEHNCYYVDCDLNSLNNDLFSDRKCKRSFFKNLFKNGYQGCCMAFRRNLTEIICPIPACIAMHDQWIGLIAELKGNVVFDEKKLILYRQHENHFSSDRIPVVKKLFFILVMLLEINKRLYMIKRGKNHGHR